MLNFLVPLLKNPLTRMIGSKVIDGINHKMEKDKIINRITVAADSCDVSLKRAEKYNKQVKPKQSNIYGTL